MLVILPQFEGSFIEFPGTLFRLRAEAGPHVLDTLFGVWVEKHHNWIPLRVVQAVHCIRRDIQHCMLVLHTEKNKNINVM